MKRWMIQLFAAALMLAVANFAEAAVCVPGEAIVVLRDVEGRGADVARAAASVRGAVVEDVYEALSDASGKVFARFKSSSMTAEELVADLAADPNVEAVSPNWVTRALDVRPNDPYYTGSKTPRLWGMDMIGMPKAWEAASGSPVYVAIIDTGIDAGHEDLAANVDLTYSKSFIGGDSTDISDGNGHGTHVAGTVGAVGNNGLGVAGVSWNTKLIALKILGSDGKGDTDAALKAINEVVRLLREDSPPRIAAINMSLGWCSPGSPEEQQRRSAEYRALKTLNDLPNAPVIVVAASNEGIEVGAPLTADLPDDFGAKGDYIYPASFIGLDKMIVVSAVASDKGAPKYTNWSSRYVDISAPGGSKNDPIVSCIPGYYGTKSGTSMATPHVTGAAALVAQKYPALKADEIKRRILGTADASVVPMNGSGAGQIVNDRRISMRGLLRVDAALLSDDAGIKSRMEIPPKEIELKIADATKAYAGSTIRVVDLLTPAEAYRDIVWSSSDVSIATVTDGVVLCKKGGTVTITASAYGSGGRGASPRATNWITIKIADEKPKPPSSGGGGGGGCATGAGLAVLAALIAATVIRRRA